MRAICARAIPYLMVLTGAVEIDRVVDLQTLQVPLALLVALCAIGMLIPSRRCA
jgi:hypothetical protein